MTPHEAKTVVRDAAYCDDGAWVLLRQGQDPGAGRILELRKALRVLWRELKEREGIPHEVGYATAAILQFANEAELNLRNAPNPVREVLLSNELPDLIQGAFDLLSGPAAESWVVRRPDLGE